MKPQCGEVSEWSKEHAWKVCKSKGFEGSNPSLSATELQKTGLMAGFLMPESFMSEYTPAEEADSLRNVLALFRGQQDGLVIPPRCAATCNDRLQ